MSLCGCEGKDRYREHCPSCDEELWNEYVKEVEAGFESKMAAKGIRVEVRGAAQTPGGRK